MKTVKYKLSGVGTKLELKVIDVLGNNYIVQKVPYIAMFFYDNTYTIKNPDFDCIKYYALKEGIEVEANKYVKVAFIELIKKTDIEISKFEERIYFWFKPSLKYTEDIKIEEIKD